MKIDLTRKTAIVTGSTQGIGRAIAAGLAASGARTVVNGRTAASVDAAIARIRLEVPDADLVGVPADVTTTDGVAAMRAAVPEADILVNSVGIFEPEGFFEITDETWYRFFTVNVMSGIRMTREYLAGMQERGWGRVIFLSSESALQIPPEMMHYGMTKTAQLALSRGLAEMSAGTGVTVNSVLPGPTASEGVAEFVAKLNPEDLRSHTEQLDDFVREHRPTQLLRRAASTEEVANMVVYLASEQASATTGSALSVDGGTRRAIF
jgi:NAD(P)-dependent dehydrogenase (short-subunit alcohol dehydrogenase family)